MRLRIWLPPLAELRADSAMEFEVLDAKRRVLNRSEGVVAALPKGIECELVLDAFDALLLEVALPKLSGVKLRKALPALVEERLMGDVDRQLVVATAREATGQATAAVVDRALFRRALEVFERAGKRVVQVTPQPFALNLPPGGAWRARVRDGRGSVRIGPTRGIGFRVTDAPPVELRLLLSQSTELPGSVEVDGDCDFQAWSDALGVAVKAGRVSEQAPPIALDLLQYEFSRSIVRWQSWRTTMALAVVLLASGLGGLNLHAWSLHAKEKSMRETMAGIVKESFPKVPVVLDPLVQMRRMTSELRAGAGTERSGFLIMASALGQMADAGSVQSLDYRDGRLTVGFVPNSVDTDAKRAALAERAATLGMDLRFAGGKATLQSKGGE
jgi:general secretion pathway protein L